MSSEHEPKSIACPECGAQIDVNALLYHQVEEELRKSFNNQLAEERKKHEKQADALNKERQSLEEQKQSLQDSIETGVKTRLQAERQQIEARLRSDIAEESAEQTKAMQDELARKSEQVKDLNKTKADLARIQREKDELKETLEAEAQTKLNSTLAEERLKIQRTADERIQLKLDERDSVIAQLRENLQEAQRKAEQGSMQLQGEVLELAIEEWLQDTFPLDTISEIKKGARGADCLHVVNTRTRQNCGSIYYESKRTKDFQPSWIEKFKQDLRAKGAHIGVIVTEAMPKDMERMGSKEGIWICSFEEFKGLSAVLRESVVQISNAIVSQENKGDKMNLLYDYVTSNEFRMQIEAIVEGFTQMQTDLISERRAMESAWKKREKQIEKVLLNTTHMYSSVKGIAGNVIPSVRQLEFGGDDETPGNDN